ncbi:hypothetical protein SAMN05446935_7497 [Burkholderia sp. YR290]|jgi:hypothetical protein|nr:hypothetical protein SAMN05446935_7497 [Burkholderia sp. YR290]
MEIKVREREYEVAVAGTDISALRTENIWSCISLAGVNDQGVGFLCHFDLPCTVDYLPKILWGVRETTDDFGTFQLKIIAAGMWAQTLNCWTHHKLRQSLERIGAFKKPIPDTTVVSPGIFGVAMKCGVVVDTVTREIQVTGPYLDRIEYGRYTQYNKKKSYRWYNYFDGMFDGEMVRTSMRPDYKN